MAYERTPVPLHFLHGFDFLIFFPSHLKHGISCGIASRAFYTRGSSGTSGFVMEAGMGFRSISDPCLSTGMAGAIGDYSSLAASFWLTLLPPMPCWLSSEVSISICCF